MRPNIGISLGHLFILCHYIYTCQAQLLGGSSKCSTNSDSTEIMGCLGPFTADVASVIHCTVDCSKLSTVINCVNAASISDICITDIPTFVDSIFTTFGSTCTYERLKAKCPASPPLRIPPGMTTHGLTTKTSTRLSATTQSNNQYTTQPWTHSTSKITTRHVQQYVSTTSYYVSDNTPAEEITSPSEGVTTNPMNARNTDEMQEDTTSGTARDASSVNIAAYPATSWLLVVLCLLVIHVQRSRITS